MLKKCLITNLVDGQIDLNGFRESSTIILNEGECKSKWCLITIRSNGEKTFLLLEPLWQIVFP